MLAAIVSAELGDRFTTPAGGLGIIRAPLGITGAGLCEGLLGFVGAPGLEEIPEGLEGDAPGLPEGLAEAGEEGDPDEEEEEPDGDDAAAEAAEADRGEVPDAEEELQAARSGVDGAAEEEDKG